MDDFKELSDLPPAPRQTPTWVLWMMSAVVLCGSLALIRAEPADKRLARSSQLTTKQAGFAAAASSRPPGH